MIIAMMIVMPMMMLLVMIIICSAEFPQLVSVHSTAKWKSRKHKEKSPLAKDRKFPATSCLARNPRLCQFFDSTLYHPRLSRFSSPLATAYYYYYWLFGLSYLFGFDFLLGFRWKNHNKQECFFYRSPDGYCYLQTHLCIIWEKVKAKN